MTAPGTVTPCSSWWTAAWDDLIDFEIVPVRTSAEAAAANAPEPGHE